MINNLKNSGRKHTPTRKRKQPLRLGLSRKMSKSNEKITSVVSTHKSLCSTKDENFVRDKINELKLNLSPQKSPKSTPRKIKNYSRLSIMTKISPMKGQIADITSSKLIMNDNDAINLPDVNTECEKTSSGDNLSTELSDGLNSNLISISNIQVHDEKDQEPLPGCSKYLSPNLNFSSDSEIESQNLGVVSFYDKSYFQINNASFTEEYSEDSQQKDTNQKFFTNLSTSYLGTSQRNNYILIPKNPPPSRHKVITSMKDYNIPLCKYENPYYSNNKDVGHQIEIGQIILKVKSKNLCDLNEFESKNEIKTMNEYRNEKLSNINNSQIILPSTNISLLITGNEQYCLIPTIKPPVRKDVNEYIKSLKKLVCEPKTENIDVKIKKEKTMHMPLSPDQDMNDSDCEIFSISPCSPLISTNENPSPISYAKDDLSNETPKTSNSKIRLNKKHKSCSQNSSTHSLRRRSLRLSLAENSSSQNICLEFISSNHVTSSKQLTTSKVDDAVQENLISTVS